MKHTKEPWVVVLNRGTKIASDVEDGYIVETKRDDIDVVNACRIVACVNACAGITNKALEAGIVLDSVRLHEAILDQQPSSFFNEYGVKVWEDV